MLDSSDVPWKIAFLLQLQKGAGIGLVGEYNELWVKEFERRGFRVFDLNRLQPSVLEGKLLDAVIRFPGRAGSVGLSLSALVGALNERGQLLGFFRHRWTLTAGIRTSIRNLLTPHTSGLGSSLRTLRRAGLPVAAVWVPIPKLQAPEELVARTDYTEIATSKASSSKAYGAFVAHFHDGFVVTAARRHLGIHALAEKIHCGMMAMDHSSTSAEVIRFDMRARGALVLFLRTSDRQVRVCRIADGPIITNHLQRHWDMQLAIRKATVNAEKVYCRIPEPFVELIIDGRKCWIECRMEGTIGWRLAPKPRHELSVQLVEFLRDLAEATAHRATFSEGDLFSLINAWPVASSRLSSSQDMERELSRLSRYLVATFTNAITTVGWAHGDFGYSNAIAAARSGQLRSVIDWETASDCCPIGVDLFNFLLQLRIIEAKETLNHAVRTLVRGLQEGTLGIEIKGIDPYLKRFLPGSADAMAVLGLTLYRWVQRDRRYAAAVGWTDDYFAAALREFTAAL
jgi:Phosphotransferase enzyme family